MKKMDKEQLKQYLNCKPKSICVSCGFNYTYSQIKSAILEGNADWEEVEALIRKLKKKKYKYQVVVGTGVFRDESWRVIAEFGTHKEAKAAAKHYAELNGFNLH